MITINEALNRFVGILVGVLRTNETVANIPVDVFEVLKDNFFEGKPNNNVHTHLTRDDNTQIFVECREQAPREENYLEYGYTHFANLISETGENLTCIASQVIDSLQNNHDYEADHQVSEQGFTLGATVASVAGIAALGTTLYFLHKNRQSNTDAASIEQLSDAMPTVKNKLS